MKAKLSIIGTAIRGFAWALFEKSDIIFVYIRIVGYIRIANIFGYFKSSEKNIQDPIP